MDGWTHVALEHIDAHQERNHHARTKHDGTLQPLLQRKKILVDSLEVMMMKVVAWKILIIHHQLQSLNRLS